MENRDISIDNMLTNLREALRMNNKELTILNDRRIKYEEVMDNLEYMRDQLHVHTMVKIPDSSEPLALLEAKCVHTNELLVNLGGKYFANMTASNAVYFCQRRIQELKLMMDNFEQQRTLLTAKLAAYDMELSNSSVANSEVQISYEQYLEEKKNHRENVRKMVRGTVEERRKISEIAPDDFFAKLDKLAAQEEENDELLEDAQNNNDDR